MEDWIDILKERLEDARESLPSDDWETFESRYAAGRKRLRPVWVVIPVAALAAAAAVTLMIVGKPSMDMVEKQVDLVDIPAEITAQNVEPAPELPAPYNARHVFKAVPNEESTPSEQVSEEPEIKETPQAESTDRTEEEIQVIPEAGNAGIDDDQARGFDDYETSGKKTRKRFVVAPRLGGMRGDAAARNPSQNGGLAYPPVFGFLGDYNMAASSSLYASTIKADHSVPVSFGLDFGLDLGRRWMLITGLDLSIYRSRFTYPLGRGDEYQKAFYLGIPLRLDWTVWQAGRFSSWIGAGGKVDRLIYGKFGENQLKDNSLNWSVLASAGFRYELSDNVGLFIAPEVSWYFRPEDPAVQTYRTENPLTPSVNAGLRFSF